MPSQETFHFEVKDLICQFEDFLNEIVIRRYDSEREIQDKLKVNVVWGHKQRVLHDIVNKQNHIQLPIIAVSMGNITRDKSRVFNKIDGSYVTAPLSADFVKLLQPVPIDLTLNVSIMTRYQIDMDQILTNFIPYSDPYVVVSWRWPDDVPGKTLEIRSTVMWNEQISMEYPSDLQNNTPLRFIANTSFTVKGWIFKNSGQPLGKIYTINTTFTGVKELDSNYQLMKDKMYQGNTDTIITSARPFIIKTIPYIAITDQPTECILIGNMMDYVSSIYVSGTDNVFPDAILHNPLSWNDAISAQYGEFTGVEILSSDWKIIDKNTISFVLPPAQQTGYIDVIAVNEAGYGVLTTDSQSIAPSITSFRFPYENGIRVVDI